MSSHTESTCGLFYSSSPSTILLEVTKNWRFMHHDTCATEIKRFRLESHRKKKASYQNWQKLKMKISTNSVDLRELTFGTNHVANIFLTYNNFKMPLHTFTTNLTLTATKCVNLKEQNPYIYLKPCTIKPKMSKLKCLFVWTSQPKQ